MEGTENCYNVLVLLQYNCMSIPEFIQPTAKLYIYHILHENEIVNAKIYHYIMIYQRFNVKLGVSSISNLLTIVKDCGVPIAETM